MRAKECTASSRLLGSSTSTTTAGGQRGNDGEDGETKPYVRKKNGTVVLPSSNDTVTIPDDVEEVNVTDPTANDSTRFSWPKGDDGNETETYESHPKDVNGTDKKELGI
jgi:hypothetical protein